MARVMRAGARRQVNVAVVTSRSRTAGGLRSRVGPADRGGSGRRSQQCRFSRAAVWPGRPVPLLATWASTTASSIAWQACCAQVGGHGVRGVRAGRLLPLCIAGSGTARWWTSFFEHVLRRGRGEQRPDRGLPVSEQARQARPAGPRHRRRPGPRRWRSGLGEATGQRRGPETFFPSPGLSRSGREAPRRG